MTELPLPLSAASEGRSSPHARLGGRRILIIGGGQDERGQQDPPIGNGRAMAVLFAREGAHIAVSDRSAVAAEATVKVITEEGGKAFSIPADMAKADEISSCVEICVAQLGGLDGVVYNAGIGSEMDLKNITPEGWDRDLAVNLRGPALMLKEALPRMSEGGAIVMISSIASFKPGSRIPAYDASKAGMAGLMRHGALEAARKGIRINIIAPGLMDTSIGRQATQGRPSRGTTAVPLGRQGTGWETANAAVFLMSDEAAYITGQILSVDGGLSSLR